MWYASDRADPVQHLDAERLGSQRSCSSGALRPAEVQEARRRGIVLGMLEHLGHHRRNVGEDRRPVLGDQLEDALGGRALREDDPRGADGEREERSEIAGVAEEELRHRRITSSSRRPRTSFAYHSQLRTRRCARDGRFGCPVEPVVNFQIAMSSLVVGADPARRACRRGSHRGQQTPLSTLRPRGSSPRSARPRPRPSRV